MSQRTRIALLILGLALLLCSLLVLAYAYWPAEVVSVKETLEPTLFSPP